ncbi:DUF4296 domain-containing protein [Galbibacter sp. EGI 63066]|uniref:DUF4296 domain-containing protein n=1 Tax=Galbibacter sp. EGI 63066 TaxID=2993559 RepID=UPI0022488423|nr:DUF4296 domain-containing protein [Galbibacter sp. EGI 63066]MCX2678812.1 DUF4296 domain-containing protein [Galbibacter sp. EGI 63066]
MREIKKLVEMKKAILVLWVFVLLVACGEDMVEKPDNLISKEVMKDIYYDIAILNAAKSTGRNKLEEKNINPDEYIYEKYNIDSVQLSKNSIYYTSKPTVQLEIFTEVEERLNALKDTLDAKLESESNRENNAKTKKKTPTKKDTVPSKQPPKKQ